MDNRSTSAYKKPIIVGIYGLPGSGKTTLLNQLKQQSEAKYFTFYDGSDVIDTVVPGGLDAFKKLPEEEKVIRREEAITKIGNECAESDRVGVVAGHCMFWPEDEKAGRWIVTGSDLATYTHILYLDAPAWIVSERCRDDTERTRESASETHLAKWQNEEKERLRKECYDRGILLSMLHFDNPRFFLDCVLRLLLDFKDHTETTNLLRAEARLDQVVGGGWNPETILVIDGDRTLAAEDTGPLIFTYAEKSLLGSIVDPLKTLFSSPMQYSYTAFRQAMLLYEDVAYRLGDDDMRERVYDPIVNELVKIRPEFQSLIELVTARHHVGVVVVTCGLGLLWEMILKKAGLNETVKVIGGGRLENGFVVTAAVKGALVTRLREHHQMYVWAFGDSPLDLEMLRMANEAIVVVGERDKRSRAMDSELKKAIDLGGLRARQLILPRGAPPRLDLAKLPEIQMEEVKSQIKEPFLIHATDKGAAQILMTATRDSSVHGPVLQGAHRRVGMYLALEYLTSVIGLEEHPIPHVQEGRAATGHRLLREDKTLIVALMRGGLPMAEGVNEAFPRAGILHAKVPDDLTVKVLAGRSAVVLVDGVINEGTTVQKFVEHIRRRDHHIRIVVVAGVVQAQSVRRYGPLRILARKQGKLNVVALRLSENKYTGSGTTDTGNRLFNSTHPE